VVFEGTADIFWAYPTFPPRGKNPLAEGRIGVWVNELFIFPNHVIDKKFQEHPRWKSTILALARTDAALTTDGQVKTRGPKKKNSRLEKGVQERIVAQAATGAQLDAA